MNKNNIDIVFFHYPCQDGLSSAWIVYYYYKLYNKKIELIPIHYGDNFNYNFRNKNILFVDFSPNDIIILDLIKNNNIYILDHHISEKVRMEKYDFAKIDITKSGVRLTWEYFFDYDIPIFLEMIEDRDLWKFRIKDTVNFCEGLYFSCNCLETIEEKLTLFDKLIIKQDIEIENYIKLGSIFNLKKNIKIKNIISNIKKYKFRGYNVCMYNCSHEMASDIGNALISNLCDLAILWHYDHNNEEYIYSLRSKNIDCSKLAKELLSGGGHLNAAGGKSKYHPTELFNDNNENKLFFIV